MIKWYENFNKWAWPKVTFANWSSLFDWIVDTTQKVGIGGVVLGLFRNNPTGSIIGALLLGISAIMTLANSRSKK